ncbi:MAG: type II toxin-antitoxin system VapC family toxin [Actinobacteria bacterium]|jgi:predicted nucleic acid-binding protein|nr:type II toxin-antitoxin system VapC family toxin [Actinomycetota bacterium]MCL6093480.1 type II toxin-antitoxin system VapC family toxin [Actinomycetota bacterium]
MVGHAVLVDTSIWVDHLRRGNDRLVELLDNAYVLCHPFIIGELACGNLKKRDEILLLLTALPGSCRAGHDETMLFLESHKLMGRGLGYVDIHLLASAALTNAPLWTLDNKLNEAAARIGLSATGPAASAG